ncbi:hypothetical protein DVH05_000632 [Phytophthora capsici]|nr:hypothetical protein DVH05_000632 [Phytophthora capsici]
MQYLDSTRNYSLTEMDMTLSFLDCWEDFGVKFDVYDVGDSPTSVAEVFAQNSNRETIPLEANTTKTHSVKQKDLRSTGKKRQRRTPKQEIERLRLLEHNLKLQLETLQP